MLVILVVLSITLAYIGFVMVISGRLWLKHLFTMQVTRNVFGSSMPPLGQKEKQLNQEEFNNSTKDLGIRKIGFVIMIFGIILVVIIIIYAYFLHKF